MNIGELTATLGVDDTSLIAASRNMYGYGEVAKQTMRTITGEGKVLIEKFKELELQLISLKAAQRKITSPEDYVAYTREIIRVNQHMKELHQKIVTTQTPLKAQKGIIEEIKSSLTLLEGAKNKAFTIEKISEYNKKIAETKMHLKEYETAGVQAMNTTPAQNMMKSLIGIGTRVLGTVASFAMLKKAVVSIVESSDVLSDRWEVASSGMKASLSIVKQSFIDLFDVITQNEEKEAGVFENVLKHIVQPITMATSLIKGKFNNELIKEQYNYLNTASDAAREYAITINKLKDAEVALIAPRAKALKLLMEARSKSRDILISFEERIGFTKQAMLMEEQETKKAIELNNIRIKALQNLKQSYLDTGRVKQWTRVMEEGLQKTIAKTSELESESYSRKRFNELQLRTLIQDRKKMYFEMIEVHAQVEERLRKQNKMLDELEAKEPIDYRKFFMLTTDVGGMGDLDKTLANIALTNSLLGDTMDQVGMQAQTYTDQISFVKEGLIALRNQGVMPGNDAMKYMGLTLDQYIAKLKELQQVQAKSTMYYNTMQDSILGIAQAFEDVSSIESFANAVIQACKNMIIALITEAIIANTAKAIKGSKTWWGALIEGAAAIAATTALFASIPKFEHGGEGIVPPGYSNDTYPMLLSSGEHYKITPSNKLEQSGGSDNNWKGEVVFRIHQDELWGILQKKNNKLKVL